MALIGATLWTGCGGSSQAAPGDNAGGPGDASSTGSGGSSMDASLPTTDASTTSDAGAPTVDAFNLRDISFPDGPIGACASCIQGMCQQDLAACASDPACQMGVICSLQNCSQYLSGSGEGGAQAYTCLVGCFGDLQTALTAISGLTCVTTSCASTCGTLVDGGFGD